MSYAKHTTTPPPWSAADAVKKMTPAAWAAFVEWKRWVEATSTQDGRGLKDVIEANAIGLDKLKIVSDEHAQRLAEAERRLLVVEARPSVGFPFA